MNSFDSVKVKLKNLCVSGNGSEHFRYGKHTCFFLLLFFLEKIKFMHFESIQEGLSYHAGIAIDDTNNTVFRKV